MISQCVTWVLEFDKEGKNKRKGLRRKFVTAMKEIYSLNAQNYLWHVYFSAEAWK